MCRNITILRGLEPPATAAEIEAGARQYVRKISGIRHPSATTEEAFERAVEAVTLATTALLTDLPPPQAAPHHRPPHAPPLTPLP